VLEGIDLALDERADGGRIANGILRRGGKREADGEHKSGDQTGEGCHAGILAASSGSPHPVRNTAPDGFSKGRGGGISLVSAGAIWCPVARNQ
jgi:hypothetical protein